MPATDFEAVIGLETHVQLGTRTKLFCGCPVRFGEPPNSLTCPICLGLPGCLPSVNETAVALALRAAVALECEIASGTRFDRKNYFYADLPKNYQITQYAFPIGRNGRVRVNGRDVRIQRLHLEEDAGKLIHENPGGRTLVDLNRAGIPLIEIVTEPDLRSDEEVQAYLETLRSILRYIGVSTCDMEKGEFRCDINLSVRPRGAGELGVKTEIKNLNSFRFAVAAIRFEFERQSGALRAGQTIRRETLLWNEAEKRCIPGRSKEEEHDYCYFPDPDLPPLEIPRDRIETIRSELPELAGPRLRRFMREHGLSEQEARVLVAERETADYFEAVVRSGARPKAAANWIRNEILRLAGKHGKAPGTLVPPGDLARLIRDVEGNRLTNLNAKEVLAEAGRTGRSVGDLVREKGLAKVSATEVLEGVVEEVIRSQRKAVEDFQRGKEASLKFLIGRVMQRTGGRADVHVVRGLLERKLRG